MTRKLAAVVGTGLVIGFLLIVGRFTQEQKATGQNAANNTQQQPERDTQPTPPGVRNAFTNSQYLTALTREAKAGGADVLSNGDSYDDFASAVQTSDGTVYVAYAAYFDGHDQIRLHKQLGNGWWSTRTYVPLAQQRSDIWMPQLAVDAQDRVWVVWSEQTGQTAEKTGNWDLYARPLDGDSWGKLVRLTTNSKPDINPHVVTDAKKNIHVVWQAHPENNGDVQYCRFDGKSWSKPLAVTDDAESDWYPRAAVDNEGTVWVAFDGYRRGDYDVYLTSIKAGELGPAIPIADSNYYEAHPSVACTDDGRVWVAWEQGGFNWGKDQGYWLRRQNRNQGTTLGSTRSIKVACWHEGKVYAAPDVAAALPMGQRQRPSAMAELATGTDGRLWLRLRNLTRGRQRGNNRFTKGWTENVTFLRSDGWAPARVLPGSIGRITVFSRMCPLQDGSLFVAYSGDARNVQNYHRPIHDTVMVKQIEQPERDPGAPELTEIAPPEPPARQNPWNTTREQRQVSAIRDFRVNIDGKEHRIVRGDLHRHTELSWDVGPGNDGSYLDFYRYMIDVALMDFGGLTDHQGGGHYPYWWWLSEKSADMYYLAPRFVPLYGYERSVTFPNGHRNVFHAYRGVPVFPFQLKTDRSGVFPGVGTGAVLDNDTKLLYEYLHGSGGIAISHTSGTASMGTDWRDNDPEVEPVVEIYQGARNSYETLGAPRVHSEDERPAAAPGGFQKAGLLWNAYDKGYRLGITSSSDHGSTHISYSMVFTPENERQAIIDSIKKRHTYGATDNLIVDFRANGHFMGDEFETGDKPKLSLKVTATSNVKELKLIRNNQYIYTSEPNKETIDFTFTDMDPVDGVNLYYFRLLQDDGEVAWSSPVWVNYEK